MKTVKPFTDTSMFQGIREYQDEAGQWFRVTNGPRIWSFFKLNPKERRYVYAGQVQAPLRASLKTVHEYWTNRR